jgi:urease accessory protein
MNSNSWHRSMRAAGPVSMVATALTLAATLPAHAHHMMGGRMPATFAEGLLSGLGHPVIGIDHLAFIVAVGLAVGVAGLSLAMPAVFVVTSAVGVAIHVGGANLPGAELVVAASVILAGGLLATRSASRASPVTGLMTWSALFAVAGLFHGYAYGESIFGAERTPLGAYLVGLVIVQTAIATGVALAMRRPLTSPLNVRLAGAVIAGIGLAVLMGQIVPAGG